MPQWKSWWIKPSSWIFSSPNAILYKLFNGLGGFYDDNDTINKQIKEADEFNKKLPSTAISSSGALTYTTHPQAIYTSKLLDFKNLPEPKNAEPEYSGK